MKVFRAFLILVVVALGSFAVYWSIVTVANAMPSASELIGQEFNRLDAACARNGEGSKECLYLDSFGRPR
ncbi:MAG: hypothetical protein A2762_01020 [Candidatus Lloydbacteria bacterium RIFCSPHIGHO2_01_FULL_54_11]|nr:MAG: hypothetical protein A2762_01020 [Candidatus Lloydbacteria bacterium RIFCSPHIGHO2_01_FULL_54_11]